MDTIQNDFKTFVYHLERNHYEYDLGSENVLRTIGSVKGANLVVGERSYDLIVIPKTMESLDNSTYQLLKEYLAKGGKVLSFTQNIPFIDGGLSENVKKLMNDYPKQWNFANNPEEASVKNLFALKDFSISEPSSRTGELYYQRRIMKDGQLIFFANSDSSQSAAATINLTGKSVVRMDLTNGKCFKVATEYKEGKISYSINLPPVGSALYYVSDANLSEPADNMDFKNEKEIKSTSNIEAGPENENVLVVDYLDLKTKNLEMKDTYFMKGMYKLYEVNKFPMGNPWQHKIQYKQDYLALDTFKVGSGFEVTYRFKISPDIDLKSLDKISAVIERPELWKVYLNGELIKKTDDWWIDKQFYRFPVGNKIRKGENVIVLKAEKMSVFAEIMPVYIVGNFILKSLPHGFEIANGSISGTGSWKEMGYPFLFSESFLQTKVYFEENGC